MSEPLTHTYRETSHGVYAIEIGNKCIGYTTRAQTTMRGGSHWIIKLSKHGDWLPTRYETRRDARMGLMRAREMQVVQ